MLAFKSSSLHPKMIIIAEVLATSWTLPKGRTRSLSSESWDPARPGSWPSGNRTRGQGGRGACESGSAESGGIESREVSGTRRNPLSLRLLWR